LDLREDWWAVEAGLIDTPDVKRIILDDLWCQLGDNELKIQRIVNNELDTTIDLRPDIIARTIERNSAVTSHTGNKPPYGYLDWWPNSLWVNTLLPPYDDVRVRRAMSLAIDRDTIDDILYEGAQVTTIFPFPLYPGLASFVARDDVQALIERYEPRKFDLAESASLMEEAGFIRNSNGLWEREGETVNATIHGFLSVHGDIVPVMEQMLLKAGFDASINYDSNVAFTQMIEGGPGMYMYGHGASIVDPYATLELFHSRFSKPIGMTTEISYFSRYNNASYDVILDEMAPLSSDDPRFLELAVQALEIYWRDQIDIPIIQWLHRIPYNQTYWTNWPTADNLGPGVSGAFWHHTGMLVVTSLEKAQ
jgi:ABC-type transport system substrate-binding protein